MTVSIFTPIHKYVPEYMAQLFVSVQDADEWIILLNGDAIQSKTIIEENFGSSTTKILTTETTGNIGALKAECCEAASGDILIEVDYDDYLFTGAIPKIKAVFNDPNVQFVYSNYISLDENGNSRIFQDGCGWKYNEVSFNGTIQKSPVAFPALPQYLRRIEWSPNHVRAFRKSGYNAIGGYDRNQKVGDDHSLMCRFYLTFGEKGFYHINECLYYYRYHKNNTWHGEANKELHINVDQNYIDYAEAMFMRWATDNGLLKLDVGGGLYCKEGYQSVDIRPEADIVQDLEGSWDQIEDNSVGVLRAYHVIEHLHNTINFFNEAYRVLAPGGALLIEVPSAHGDGAFADPTHVKYFVPISFEYYTKENKARFIRPQFKGAFQMMRLVEYMWTNPDMPIISAQMVALKGFYHEQWCGIREI